MDDSASARLRRVVSPSQWHTGAKLFLIISAALLPLAVIGMLATLQTSRLVNVETRARLRVAAEESSHALGIELIGDMTALRAAMAALERDPADAPSCARVQGVFAQQSASGVRFSILDTNGKLLCGAPPPAALKSTEIRAEGPVASRVLADGLLLGIAVQPGRHDYALAYFPTAFLAAAGRPSLSNMGYGTTVMRGDDRLQLNVLDDPTRPFGRETRTVPLGIGDLSLEMQVRSAPITSSLVIALLLPVLMWAAAAGIAWFVVDRLLIRPLRQLRSSVAAFVPGEVIDPGILRSLPAQEIRELGDTFRAISRTVALHEAGLAEGLVRQTKLTREVHHRVKNNLQVISSLINIHARGSNSEAATDAYAAIQRRVDALAVVHRNHFAEAEVTRGLNLRAIIGELASNIRATAAPRSGLGVVLDIDPFLVSQDVAVAISFLVTELIELAMTCDRAAQVRVSAKPDTADPARAILRVSARALQESAALEALVEERYGRVTTGLARQLRAPLHHDPLVGAYEIAFAVNGVA